MNRPAESCPEDAEISGFLLGELTSERMDQLATHFDTCPSCDTRAENLEGVADEVVTALRESATRHGVGDQPWLVSPTPGKNTDGDAFSIGARLGDYELIGTLGEGGMGQVFRARHVLMDRIVAVKTIRPEVAWSGDVSARFQREMQAAAQLSHPNVVSALDAGIHRASPYLVMELVEGRTLSEWVQENGPLPPDQAVDMISQAAQGLESVHRSGLIHRDVKPSNLILNEQGVLKVSDVGLARFDESNQSESAAGRNETSTSVVMGSVDYMSPEQARSSRDVDQRADVYSLACTLYFLLTGSPPFTGECSLDVLIAHREQSPPRLPDTISASVRSAWLRAMAREPSERFASMDEFRQALLVTTPGHHSAGTT